LFQTKIPKFCFGIFSFAGLFFQAPPKMQMVVNNTRCGFFQNCNAKLHSKTRYGVVAKLPRELLVHSKTVCGNVERERCKKRLQNSKRKRSKKTFTKVCVANLLKQNQRVETTERMPSFCCTTY